MVFPCLVTLFVFFSNALSYVRQGAEHFDIAPEHSLPDATFLSSGLDEDVVMGDEVKEGVAEVSSGDAHKRVDAANAADGQQQEQGEKEEEGEEDVDDENSDDDYEFSVDMSSDSRTALARVPLRVCMNDADTLKARFSMPCHYCCHTPASSTAWTASTRAATTTHQTLWRRAVPATRCEAAWPSMNSSTTCAVFISTDTLRTEKVHQSRCVS
jgi:hypothetical protein